MREIKFRMWSKHINKMIYPPWARDSLAESKLSKEFGSLESSEPQWDNEDGMGDLLIMQYTGLKDENGKEIYESDILKIQPNPEEYLIVEVLFHQGCFCYNHRGGLFAFYSNVPGHNFTEFREVIGNIYQEPELMKNETV